VGLHIRTVKQSKKTYFATVFGGFLFISSCNVLFADSPPTPENPSSVWPTAITFTWDPTAAFNSTLYWLQITDDPTYATFFGNIVTQYSSWTLTGLTPGTTYYARVAANYAQPNQTAFADLPATITPTVGAPGPAVINPVITGETYNSISVDWTAPFSPPVTNKGFGSRQYTVQASTASDFTGSIVSGLTISTSLTISGLGLAAGTTYYVRVGALYPTGNGTTGTVNYTPTTPTYVFTDSTDVVTGLTAYQVGNSSITWTWNPVPAATAYNVYQATSPTTLIANVVVTTFTETGLTLNTLYGRTVAAVIAGSEHALCHATSSYTLTPPPGAPTFTEVAFTSATVNWNANGNPPGTSYEYILAYDYGYSGYVYGTVNTSATLSNLAEGSTFYLSVASINSAGVRTRSPISMLRTPGNFVPQNFTATPTGTTSGTWSWDAPLGASSYALYPDTSTSTPSETTSGQVYTKVGLTPNTAYVRYLRAYLNANVFSDWMGPATIYTWAASPGQPTFSNISFTSATLTWTASSNPSGTPYEVSQSTVSDFSSAVSTPIAFTANFTGTTTTFINLLSGTPYYFRVRAQNLQNIVTSFSSTGSATTLSTPLTSLISGTAQGTSSITWTWNAVAGATYNLYDADHASLIAGGIVATSYTEINLSTNTSYSRQVTAVLYGESALSTSLSTSTWASPPTASNPSNIQSTQFIAHWGANGNPLGTYYLVRTSSDLGFSSIMASSHTVANSAILTGLQADTTYYTQVQAMNTDGIATGFIDLPSTRTLAVPDITFSTITFSTTTQVVDPDVNQTIVFNSSDGPVVLNIPSGSFPNTVTVTVQEATNLPQAAANAGTFQGTGIGIQIDLDTPAEPSKPATLSIPFRDAELSGLDKSTLVISRYDPVRHIWIPYVSTIDTTQNIVTARIDHFSLYQLLAALPPHVLNAVQIYPNPFRPALGHTAVTVSNVPPYSRIRIYTLAGEQVKDLSANAAGMASWDTTNQSGRFVASGLYFVLVQGTGDKNRLRVVIQR